MMPTEYSCKRKQATFTGVHPARKRKLNLLN